MYMDNKYEKIPRCSRNNGKENVQRVHGTTSGPSFLPNVITVTLSLDGLLRQLIDAHSNVFENAEQDHVVDAGPDKNDG